MNICSLRYKIDELRLLQRICGFDILGISETHLDSSVPDNFLQIDGLQLIRRDRTKCKGGGVALYYAEHLTAVHRKDLLVRDIEAIWIQVKFPTHTTLFSAYKKLRNEITADIRRAKAKHFKDLLADVKTTAEYWNLLSKANNPK